MNYGMILMSVALLAATVAGAGETPLWRAKFGEGGNVTVMRHVKYVPLENGDAAAFTNRATHVEVKEFPKFKGPVRLSFRVRYLNRNEHNPLQTIRLVTTSGVTFDYIMYCGNGISHAVKTSLGASISGSYKTNGPSGFDYGENSHWQHYSFDFGEDSFVSRKEATVVDTGNVGIGYPAYFKFGGIYGTEVRDFVITPIPKPPKPVYVKKPTFTLDHSDVPFRGEQLIPVRKPLNPSAGGVLFWANNCKLDLLDEKKNRVARFEAFGGCHMRTHIAVGPGTNVYERAIDRSANRADNAWHYAFTWDEKGHARMFLNGLPYGTSFDSGPAAQLPMTGNRLGETRYILISGQTNGVQKLVTYARPVSNREVLAHYRERMPIDLVFDKSVVPSDRPVPVTVVVAPGGAYTKPNPVEPAELVKSEIDLELKVERIELRRDNPQHPLQVTSRKFIPFGGVTRHESLKIDREREVSTDPVTLPAGDYRIVCAITRKAPGAVAYVRSLYFSATPDAPKRNAPASVEKWRGTETLFDREYRNDSDFDKVLRDERGPRFYQVVSVPDEAVGRPCLLSVTWPDDRPRSFGLYWYPEGGCGNRDRLQAGIQAGHEFPNSGENETAEYLVYPSGKNSLLEIRTYVPGWDAKVTHVKLERLAEPLPKLQVNLPEGLPARHFGNTDEDQTFYNNFNPDVDGSVGGITDRVIDYLDYTGQDRFHYSVARYSYMLGPVEGSIGPRMFPRLQGELGFIIDRFAERGVDFVGKLALNTTPLFDNLDLIDCDYRAQGAISLDREGLDIRRFGAGKIQGNPANPLAREHFFDYFAPVIDSHAGNYGDIWYDFGWGFGPWGSLNQGYDDWTIGRFLKESPAISKLDGTVRAKLKELAKPAHEPGDYLARWTLLTSTNAPVVRAAWLRWRADAVTTFTRELVARVRRGNPKLHLLINTPIGEAAYAEHGIDVEAIAAIDGVKLGCGIFTTGARADLRGRKPTDEAVASLDEKLAERDAEYAEKLKTIRSLAGAVGLVQINGVYFETPDGPPKEEIAGHRFPCPFEDADAKYHGRYFLKEFAEAVGYGDAQEIVSGGQPVGSLGSEEVVREFVRAYRALPALPFRDLRGFAAKDGAKVVGRALKTNNGLYFYFVNLTPEARSVKSPIADARDLSSGVAIENQEVALKPFELRSFISRR